MRSLFAIAAALALLATTAATGDAVECVGCHALPLLLDSLDIKPDGAGGLVVTLTTTGSNDFELQRSADAPHDFVLFSPASQGVGPLLRSRLYGDLPNGVNLTLFPDGVVAVVKEVQAELLTGCGPADPSAACGLRLNFTLQLDAVQSSSVTGSKPAPSSQDFVVKIPAVKPPAPTVVPQIKTYRVRYADPMRLAYVLMDTGLVPPGKVQVYDNDRPKLKFTAAGVESSGDSTTPAGTVAKGKDEDGPKSVIDVSTADKDLPALQVFDLSSAPERWLVVNDEWGTWPEICRVLRQLDAAPKVVELEVRVCEVSQQGLDNLGLLFQGSGSSRRGDGPSFGTLLTEGFSGPNNHFDVFSLGDYTRSTGFDIDATLNALVDRGYASVLAAPCLSTLDGREAGFFAGDSVPYVSSPASALQGSAEVSYLQVGVNLCFKPRCDYGGAQDDLDYADQRQMQVHTDPCAETITIELRPSVSSVADARVQVGQDLIAPRLSNRVLSSTVRLHPGECFLMAGLINDQEIEAVRKVPLLGDLPLVGKLFRNKNKRNERTEILVFVTPHIRGEDAACGTWSDPRWGILDEMQLESR